MDSGREVDTSSIVDRIAKNSQLIDTVGFCGGEPTLQEPALLDICQQVRQFGQEVFINTNGTRPTVIARLVRENLLSFLTVDVKAPLDQSDYQKVVGVPDPEGTVVSRVKETLRICQNMRVPLEIRTTVVPTLTDYEAFVKRIADDIPPNVKYMLQQFSPEGDILDQRFKQVMAPSRQRMLELARTAAQEGLSKVYIRTRDGGEERVTI